DGLGRLIAFVRTVRGREPLVPFDFEMIVAYTTYNRIVVKAEGRGDYPSTVTEASFLTPLPPAPWNDYRLLLWPVLEERPPDYLTTLRGTGFDYVFLDRRSPPELPLRNNLSCVVRSLLAPDSLRQDDDVWRAALLAYVESGTLPQSPSDQSLASPRTLIRLKEDVASAIAPVLYARPAAYSLGQGLGLTFDGDPLDLSFDRETLAAFRSYLARAYGTPAALNRVWDTRYLRWDDVRPEATLDVVARCAKPARRRPPYNFAPWMDFRLFMDDLFTSTLEGVVAHVRSLDPDTPVGLMGSVTPSAWAGIDYLRLARSLDFLESDSAGVLNAIFRARPATAGSSARILTQLDLDAPDFDASLWRSVLSADHGAVLLDDEKFFAAGGKLSRTALARLETLRAARAGWLRMLSLPSSRKDAVVALYYSRPSLLVSTILDVVSKPEDAATYLREWQPAKATYILNFLAWCRLLEDLGLPYDVVSAPDWRDRSFLDRPYRVLILPKLLAVRDEDLAAVRSFAAAGRPVLADNLAGVFDSRGRELDSSPFDDLFGVSRRPPYERLPLASDLRAQTPAPLAGRRDEGKLPDPLVSLRSALDLGKLGLAEKGVGVVRRPYFYKVEDAAAVILNPTSQGATNVYLNLSLLPYVSGGDAAAILRALLEGLFAFLDVRPEVTVTIDGKPASDVEVHACRADELYFVGLIRRGAKTPDEKPAECQVRLPFTRHVFDLVRRRYYGPVDRVLVSVERGTPVLLGAFPYSVRFMNLELFIKDFVLTWNAEVVPAQPSVRVGYHLFEVALTDAAGKPLVPPETLVAYKGYSEREIPLSRDIPPGRYRLTVTDLVTSARAEREFDVSAPQTGP
ncbi:MAG: alpha-amylase family protein, partial [Planctomycetota bacterium]